MMDLRQVLCGLASLTFGIGMADFACLPTFKRPDASWPCHRAPVLLCNGEGQPSDPSEPGRLLVPKHAPSTPLAQPALLTNSLALSGVRFYALCFMAERGEFGTLSDLQADLCQHTGETAPLPSLYVVVWRLECDALIEKVGERRTSVSRGTGQNLYRVTPKGRCLLAATREHCHRLARHIDQALM